MPEFQTGAFYRLLGDDLHYVAQKTATGARVLVRPGRPDDTLLILNGQVFDRQMVHVCNADELILMRV